MLHNLLATTTRIGLSVTALGVVACGGQKSATAPETVARIVVMPDSVRLEALGSSQSLHAVAYSARGKPLARQFGWVSTDPSIATVTSAGGDDSQRLATAVAAGTTRVVATSEGVEGSSLVVVLQSVASVDISPSSAVLDALGAHVAFSAALADATGHSLEGRTVAWSSSDSTVATVDGDGVATALAEGQASIRAASGSETAAATLTVDQVVVSVRIAPVTVELTALGESDSLQASAFDAGGSEVKSAGVSWQSSDSSVATIDQGGLLKAVGTGKTRVIASSEGVADSIDVVVRQRVTRLVVDPDTLHFDALHRTVPVSITAFDAGGSVVPDVSIQWESSDAGVASVSDVGEITSLDNGTATISARIGSATAAVSVSVAQVVDRISATPGSLDLTSLNETVRIIGVALDPGGTPVSGATLSWTSSDPSVVTVTSQGVVRATQNGRATVTARAEPVATKIPARVQQRVARIDVTPDVNPVVPGNSIPLEVRLADALGSVVAGATCSWSTSNSSAATVNADGVVSAYHVGSALIRCANTEAVGSATVNVVSAAWPNKPAGYVTFNDQPWNALASNGWDHVNLASEGRIVSDPTAPMSPPNVLEEYYPKGYPANGVEPSADYLLVGGARAMFVGTWFKASPNWQGHPTGINKIFFFFNSGAYESANIIFVMRGPPGGPYYLQPYGQDYPDTRGFLAQNAHQVPMVPGRWYRLEFQFDIDRKIIRWWQDGVLLGSYTDYGYPPAGFRNVDITSTWGGAGTQPKQHDDYFRFDHTYVSVPGG